jgi:hypothetical protein
MHIQEDKTIEATWEKTQGTGFAFSNVGTPRIKEPIW